jgi:hypothetical protein
MALFNGSQVVADTTGLRMSRFTSAARPANPVQGQTIWNTTTKRLEMFDGAYWKEVRDGLRPYLYRTIITTSYVYGGYKDVVPWRNANRLVHATDVCTNLGDLLVTPAAYTSGACNRTLAFLWGCTTAWPGSSTVTSAMNMATETNAGSTTSWDMRISRDDSGTIFKETEFAYIVGGGSAGVDVFNLTNQTMYKSQTGPDTNTAGDGDTQNSIATLSDETAGYGWSVNNSFKLYFSTTVRYTVTDNGVRGSHGQQKGINSKLGKGYCGNEGSYNGGFTLRRWVFSTETNIGNVAKPIGNCGEENFDMGQDKQYCLGNYDGAQNNRTWRFSYTTDSGVELGAGSVRTGVPGGSSGHCGWKG